VDSRSGLRRCNERRLAASLHACGLSTTHHARSGRAQPQALWAFVLCRRPPATQKRHDFQCIHPQVAVKTSHQDAPDAETLAHRRQQEPSATRSPRLPGDARRCQAVLGNASLSQAVVKKKRKAYPQEPEGPFLLPRAPGQLPHQRLHRALWLGVDWRVTVQLPEQRGPSGN